MQRPDWESTRNVVVPAQCEVWNSGGQKLVQKTWFSGLHGKKKIWKQVKLASGFKDTICKKNPKNLTAKT